MLHRAAAAATGTAATGPAAVNTSGIANIGDTNPRSPISTMLTAEQMDATHSALGFQVGVFDMLTLIAVANRAMLFVP